MAWISVRNWRKFQHYDPAKRQPPWIKNYTELTHSDAYLSLGAGERSLLHGIWIEYASSQCSLKFDSILLGRRLNLRVTKEQLQALVNAGWIANVASKTLAEGYHDASARAHVVEVETEEEEEVEKEKEQTLQPSDLAVDENGRMEGMTLPRRTTEAEIADSGRDEYGVPTGFERQPSTSNFFPIPDNILKKL